MKCESVLAITMGVLCFATAVAGLATFVAWWNKAMYDACREGSLDRRSAEARARKTWPAGPEEAP
jgi:uncharacterized iron-regulated membrane protein